MDYNIAAVSRGLLIMQLFNDRRPRLSISQIARLTDMVPSTTFRIVQTICAEGLLDKVSDVPEYAPSIVVQELAVCAAATIPGYEELGRIVADLCHSSGFSASLGVLDGQDVVLLLNEEPHDSGIVHFQPGLRFLARSMTLGLAAMSLLEDLSAFQLTAPELRAAETVARKGYREPRPALDFPAHLCVAAPFIMAGGRAGAVCVWVPMTGASRVVIAPETVSAVRAAARRVSSVGEEAHG